jgi:hypothetical protein
LLLLEVAFWRVAASALFDILSQEQFLRTDSESTWPTLIESPSPDEMPFIGPISLVDTPVFDIVGRG